MALLSGDRESLTQAYSALLSFGSDSVVEIDLKKKQRTACEFAIVKSRKSIVQAFWGHPRFLACDRSVQELRMKPLRQETSREPAVHRLGAKYRIQICAVHWLG